MKAFCCFNKPDSVWCYHLSVLQVALKNQAAYPSRPLRRERVILQFSLPWPMWHFSTQGLPTIYIAVNCRELLPHVFTLIHLWRTVIICGTFCSRRIGTRLFTGAMLYAVRTFLVYKKRDSFYSLAKLRNIHAIGITAISTLALHLESCFEQLRKVNRPIYHCIHL